MDPDSKAAVSALGISQRHLFDVLSGRIFADEKPKSRTIRLFISSNPIDSAEERNALMNIVYPQVKSFCYEFGYHFHMIDLYSGKECTVKEYSVSFDTHHLKKAINEIKICQEFSNGPNFILLLSHRYCPRKLPVTILSEDFQLMYPLIDDPGIKNLITEWYQLNDNANPPQYILQPPVSKFQLYGDTDEKVSQQWNEWLSIAHSMETSIRKAVKAALGKDKVKAQIYLNSVLEDEIVQGVFCSPGDPNNQSAWFKRTFTNLYAVNIRDPARHVFLDTLYNSNDLDSDALKSLNHLKETRMTAKYIGLDPRNIFDFPINWIKGLGLDTVGEESHKAYLLEFCGRVLDFLKDKILYSMETTTLSLKVMGGLYQEVLWHTHYATSKLKKFFGQRKVVSLIMEYINGPDNRPLALYGYSGSGKTYIMAQVACILKEKYNLQKASIIVRFVGITYHSSCIRMLLRSICQQIAAVYQSKVKLPNQYHSIVQCFSQLLRLSSQERPLFILLDGIDQLSKEDGLAGLSWLPDKLPKHVKIILSTVQDEKFQIYPVLCSMYGSTSTNLVEVSYLKLNDSKEMFEHLMSLEHRRLNVCQNNTIANYLNVAVGPLQIQLVSNIACKWKSFSQVTMVEESVSAIVKALFIKLEENVGFSFVSHSLAYITAAKSGVSETELMELLACDEEVCNEIFHGRESNFFPLSLWSEVLYQLRDLLEFRITDGAILVLCWTHRIFNEIAMERYLLPIQELIYKRLTNYFAAKSEISDLNRSNGKISTSYSGAVTTCPLINKHPLMLNKECLIYNHRKLSELPYCLAKLGSMKGLQQVVCDWEWMMSKIAATTCEDYVADLAPLVPIVSHIRIISYFGSLQAYKFFYQKSRKEEIIQWDARQSNTNTHSYHPCPWLRLGHRNTTDVMAELRLLKEAFVCSSGALFSDATALPSQLIGRLYPYLMDPLISRPLIEKVVKQCLFSSPLFIPLTPPLILPGGPLLTTLKGHRDAVTSLNLLTSIQDGNSTMNVVSGSLDKSIKTWELENGSVMKTMDRHSKGILCIAVASNKPYIVSGSADCTARFWNLHTGELIYTLFGHTKEVSAVAVTSEGDKAISGSYDCMIKVWNTDINSRCSGELIFTLSGRHDAVTAVCLAQNDEHLVTGDSSGKIEVWNIVSCEMMHLFNLHTKDICAIAMTTTWPYYIASCSRDNSIRIWTIDCGKCVQTMYNTEESQLTSLTISDTGKIITGTDSGIVMVWNTQTGKLDYRLNGHSASVQCVSALRNGYIAVSCSNDCTICVWDLVIKPFSPLASAHDGNVNCMVCCTEFYMSSGTDRKLLIWESGTKEIDQEIQLEHETRCIAVCQDFSTSIMGSSNGLILLYDSKSHKLLTLLIGHKAAVNSMAVSVHEEFLVTGAQDHLVIIWCLNEFKKLKTLRKHNAPVTAVCFAQTAQYYLVITASQDGLLVFQDLNLPEKLFQVIEHKSAITALLPDNENMKLASSSDDQTVKIWSLPDGIVLHTLRGHSAEVTSIDYFTSDKIISSSLDKTIRVWDIKSESCITSYFADEPISALAVTEHGPDILVYYGTNKGNVLALNLMFKIDDPSALFDKLHSNTQQFDQPSVEITKAVSYDKSAPMDTILEEYGSEDSHVLNSSTDLVVDHNNSDAESLISSVFKHDTSIDNHQHTEPQSVEGKKDYQNISKSSICILV